MNDVIYNFKMAAAAGPYYFRFRKILMMALCSEGQRLSANQISSTSLNLRLIYFQFGKTNVFLPVAILRPYRSGRVIPHQATKFRPNREMTSCIFSRWRRRRLNTTSGFVCNDVTFIRRSCKTQNLSARPLTKFHRGIAYMGNACLTQCYTIYGA